MIAAGARWIIGSGNTINIVGQPWLTDSPNPYLSTESQGLTGNKVSSLMHTEHRSWDIEIIRDMFNVRDQRCILNTYIDQERVEDPLYNESKPKVIQIRSYYRTS